MYNKNKTRAADFAARVLFIETLQIEMTRFEPFKRIICDGIDDCRNT